MTRARGVTFYYFPDFLLPWGSSPLEKRRGDRDADVVHILGVPGREVIRRFIFMLRVKKEKMTIIKGKKRGKESF